MTFPCTQCGACCKRAWTIKGYVPIKEDGSCQHLLEDNTCEIYDTRPLICRVEETYGVMKTEMSKEEFFKMNSEACNRMITEDKLDDKYLIDIQAHYEPNKL